MGDPLKLASVLDLNAAGPLRSELLARRGADLTLDASAVDRLGGLCLQVLLSAQKTWANDGFNLKLGFPSQAFVHQWAAFGAPHVETEGVVA